MAQNKFNLKRLKRRKDNRTSSKKQSKYQYVTVHQMLFYRFSDIDQAFLKEEGLEFPIKSYPVEVLGNDIRISETKEDAKKDVEHFMHLYGELGVKNITKRLHVAGFDTIRIRTEWYWSEKYECNVQQLHIIDTHIFKDGVAI